MSQHPGLGQWSVTILWNVASLNSWQNKTTIITKQNKTKHFWWSFRATIWTYLLQAKSKIRAQKMDETTIRCNCRICKCVKILLWIWNPGEIIFKICWSADLFTPLHELYEIMNWAITKRDKIKLLLSLDLNINIHHWSSKFCPLNHLFRF